MTIPSRVPLAESMAWVDGQVTVTSIWPVPTMLAYRRIGTSTEASAITATFVAEPWATNVPARYACTVMVQLPVESATLTVLSLVTWSLTEDGPVKLIRWESAVIDGCIVLATVDVSRRIFTVPCPVVDDWNKKHEDSCRHAVRKSMPTVAGA